MVVFSAIMAMLPAWGGAVTIGGLSSAVSGAIISIGKSALWSIAAMQMTSQNMPRQTVMATLTETDRARIRSYGRNLSGGLRVFWEADGGRLHQVVVYNHGQVDGIVGFWIDGEPVAMTPNGAGLYRRDRYTAFAYRDGSGAGGNYAGVFAGDGLGWSDLSAAFPTLWTAQHRLQGQATFYAVFGDPSDEDFVKFFPKGPNTQVQIEYRGGRVRNMAGDLVYSENAGLCIRDLMTHQDGWNIAAGRLDTASWQGFVALCDQQIPVLGGGTEPRYRICGFYSLDDALKDVTQRMLQACDGQIYETAEGKIGILGGAWSEPDVTITDADILEISMVDGYDPFTDYNVLKGSFVSPAHGYQPTEVAELRDETALLTQPERVEQYDVDLCPASSQMQRLLKIKRAKDSRDFEGTIRTNLVGMKARFPKGDGLHTIRIVAPEAGLDGVFEVTGHAFSIPDGFCEIGVASITNPYGWTVAEEKPLPPGVAEIAKPSKAVPVPTGITLVQEPVTVSGDVVGARLVVTVADPGRQDLHLRAQYRRIGGVGVQWFDMQGDRLWAETGLIDDLTNFEVRVSWRRYNEWVSAGTISVISNPDVPAAPTSFSAVAAGGSVALDWINAPSDYYRTQVWRGTTSVFANAGLIQTVSGLSGQVSGYEDTPGLTGALYYWVRTINRSGVPSAPAGPRSVTL